LCHLSSLKKAPQRGDGKGESSKKRRGGGNKKKEALMVGLELQLGGGGENIKLMKIKTRTHHKKTKIKWYCTRLCYGPRREREGKVRKKITSMCAR